MIDIYAANFDPMDSIFKATHRLSVSSTGGQATQNPQSPGVELSTNPDVTGNGLVAVYESSAIGLIANDTNNRQDIFQTFRPEGPFKRSDADGDGNPDQTDAIRIQEWL